MRTSFRHAGYVVATVLLGLVGMVVMTGTAAAEEQPNALLPTISDTFLRPCPSPCGIQDAVGVKADTNVHTYCRQGDYNVMYSGPLTGRGGFVLRLRLDFPNLQQQSCTSAGAFASVIASSTLRSCSGPCVDFGAVAAGSTTGVFCQLGTSPNRWFLLYVDQINRAGFLPESALNTPLPAVPNCNQGL